MYLSDSAAAELFVQGECIGVLMTVMEQRGRYTHCLAGSRVRVTNGQLEEVQTGAGWKGAPLTRVDVEQLQPDAKEDLAHNLELVQSCVDIISSRQNSHFEERVADWVARCGVPPAPSSPQPLSLWLAGALLEEDDASTRQEALECTTSERLLAMHKLLTQYQPKTDCYFSD